ncbi:MAG: VWA domain-containing protein [Clostridia bacterium]|nr:VWA domain-containing protein [Clostridia bacterium]
MADLKQLKRWRLILGENANETLGSYANEAFSLSQEESIMDEALAAIYDGVGEGEGSERLAGKGSSSPRIAKWLADIRTFFKEDVVSVIQTDAIERKGLKQLLFEPEVLKNVQPNIEMVATLMSLRGKIPEKTKDTARQLVKAVVDEINKKLENDIRRAVTGALNKRQHSPIPNVSSIDWKLTIRRNLKNYDRVQKRMIPERFYFFDRKKSTNNWTVILDMDQSGSMADSIIYASVAGAIFASMASINTRIVAFDTEIVDLSEQYDNDPVDMLFGIQLGGGTDINKSVAYCEKFISDPKKTIFILISDLYEGGNQASLVRRMSEMKEAGVKVMCLLALSDKGAPFYDENLARKLSSLGIPCFACTPTLLPELLEGALKGNDLSELAKKLLESRKK